MKYFTQLLEELKHYPKKFQAGESLPPPALLRKANINGARTTYLEMGIRHTKGPALVFIHGFAGFFLDWPRVITPISRYYRTYAVDLMGWGFSEEREKKYMFRHEVEEFTKFLDHIPFSEVVLVGVSYGGGVAWGSAAFKHPKIKSIMLLNPMPPFPLRFLDSFHFKIIFYANRFLTLSKIGRYFLTRLQVKQASYDCVRNGEKIDEFYIDLAYLILKQPHMPNVFNKFARAAKYEDWKFWEDSLKNVEIPTTIMFGENDNVFLSKVHDYWKGLMPHVRQIHVPNCGHAMLFDQYRRVILEIYEHMKLHHQTADRRRFSAS